MFRSDLLNDAGYGGGGNRTRVLGPFVRLRLARSGAGRPGRHGASWKPQEPAPDYLWRNTAAIVAFVIALGFVIASAQ